jgi:hypothetical protein
MEVKMAGDPEFASTALQVAAFELQEEITTAQRAYEDAQRYQDPNSAGHALRDYISAKQRYDSLVQATSPPQNANGQLSNAQRNFLSRRVAGGDELTPQRMKDYALAHTRAVNAGLEVDSDAYFRAVAHHADTMGDGRQPPLDEREAAKISGVDEETYAHHARTLRALKARGLYQD